MQQHKPADIPQAVHLSPDLIHGLDSMIGASPIGYAYISHPDRRIIYANRSAARMVGLPPARLIGLTTDQIFGREMVEKVIAHILEAVDSPEGQGMVEVPAALPGRPDEPGVYRMYCHAVRDANGCHVATWHIIQEVTSERRLEAEARDQKVHLQAVMDIAPTGVVISDETGKLLYANKEAERIWGHPLVSADSPHDYRRYHLYDEDENPIHPRNTTVARTIATRSPLRDTKRLVKRPDGTIVTVLENSAPLLDESGELTGAVVAFHDVTELELLQRRQQRLAGIAQAVNADISLLDILRLVRDAIVETAGVDRAGVWIYDEEAGKLRGSWGTDMEGRAVDESEEEFPLRPTDDHRYAPLLSGEAVVYRSMTKRSNPDLEPVCSGATLALTADDRVIGMVSVDNLITNRPVSEKAIDALLPFCEQAAIAIESARLRQTEREQTAWLKDAVKVTNHRVKNNLQVALAIIDTELVDGEPVDRSTLERIRRQIRIIGSVNEFLGDVSPELETSLCEIMERVLGVFENGREMSCKMDCEDLVVNTKQATAVALILDELVSNAGLRGARSVEITLRRRDDNVLLEVSDNGAALPKDFRSDPDSDKGFGFVERLARWDLLGRVSFANRSGGGVCVAVEFALNAQHGLGAPARTW